MTTTMANNPPLRLPKSILKKPTYPTNSPSTPKEVRDREVALYHAHLIQQRKDLELEILSSIETLIDFPIASPPTYTSASPSQQDSRAFKRHLLTFQPSDYDSLIEERNIDKKCGYALCPNPKPKDSGGVWRVLNKTGKAKDFKIVPKEEFEKWCSDECAKRALYVRVQLDECPAWERSVLGGDVQLLDEPKSVEGGEMMEGVQNLSIRDRTADEESRKINDLALERGDKGSVVKVDIDVTDKQINRPAEPPSLEVTKMSGELENLHLAVEGYKSDFDHKKAIGKKEEDQDMDWGESIVSAR
jgi:hypothetical protein